MLEEYRAFRILVFLVLFFGRDRWAVQYRSSSDGPAGEVSS